MHFHTKITTLLAMLSAGFVVTALAQSAAPSFFGGASSTSSAGTSTTPKASTSQVWSKDDFTKQVQTLKAQNQAEFQQKLNAELKPMPAGTGQTAALPVATPPAAMPVDNTPAPTANTATQSPTPPPASSSGYTGFATPPAKTSGAPSKPAAGWGVNY